MSRRLRALTCIALAAPLLACSGNLDLNTWLSGGAEDPVIVPGTPAEPGPGDAQAANRGSIPCGDPCQILLEHDFDALRDGVYCDLCGDSDLTACEGTWLGDLNCGQYDWLRNCIYARLGYGFAGSDWRQIFDKEPWYRADPSFRWDQVTAVQVQNAKTLQQIVENRECRD